MPSERDFHEIYEERLERAHERGFESLREEQEWRAAARELGDYDRDEITTLSTFMHDYHPGGYDEAGDWHSGDMDIDAFKDLWMELEHDGGEYDESYDDDFYAWLQEFYDQT